MSYKLDILTKERMLLNAVCRAIRDEIISLEESG
jgi:hypothetical protein